MIVENYYSEELNKIYEQLSTDPKNGLKEEEAEKRLKQYGINEIPKVSQGFIKIYLAPLFNWLIVIYIIAALILFIAGLFFPVGRNIQTLVITLGIVAFNCLIAIFQQYRATKKLKALRELAQPTTTVIRNGEKKEISTKSVVIGDILVLSQGDKISADARIIKAANLEINEASLTGESEPVKKYLDGKAIIASEDVPLQDQKNMIFYGTYITTGTGSSVVVKTGGATEIGKISKGLEEAGTSEIPIRAKMNNFGKYLGLGVVIFWLIIVMIKWAATGEFEFFKSLNSAMDIMPINIPLLVTIILLTGVLAMAQHGVIVRNIASVDSLGRVSVVCSDKTGTLTKNQMCVQNVWTNGSIFKITGIGYNPEGEILLMDDPKNIITIKHLENYPYLKLLLIAGYLNNNSALVKKEVETAGKVSKKVYNWNIIGSPTEGALMVLYQKGMANYILEDYQPIKEYPFDSSIKRMTKIFKKQNENYSFTKGATEIIVPLCFKIAYNNQEIEFSDDLKNKVLEKANDYASQGFRILSLAYKRLDNIPAEQDENGRQMCETDMVYLGFVTILDPAREGVQQSVEECNDAGVNVIMITGDSVVTAKAIAKQISIIKSQDEIAIEGKNIKNINSTEDFNKTKVFARVSPEHKQDIITRYQEQKKVVAMTGDGVNDALALNMADAGLAMGIQGTDVAKEASDMVISDDSFNSIVKGIHQGRGIFAKIRAVVFFYICINLFEGVVQFILAVILGYPYFLSDDFYFQWVFLAITLHTFPGLVLTFDSISKDVMKEKPRDSEEILTKKTMILMIAYGGLLAVSMLVVYFICLSGIYPVFPENHEFGGLNIAYLYTKETMNLTPNVRLNEVKALTMLMVTLYFCESFLVFQIRRPNKSLLKAFKEDSNKFMYLLIGLLFGILLALMYIPGFQIILALIEINFMFMFLTAFDWLICFLIALICIISFEILKYIARKKNIYY
jgi:Ca2+-transporting ATPase